jgi:cyclic pyranopterin phosphate synthase
MLVLANDKMRMIVTGKCNLGCFYCHNEGQAKEDTFASVRYVRDLTSALVVEDVVVDEITISGGEPLLHSDIEMIVGLASDAASHITMVSNGLLATPQLLQRLARNGLKKFRLGVDSLQPDKPRPSRGRLTEPFDAARLLSAAADAGLEVDLNVVVTKFNRHQVLDLVRFAVEHAVSVKFFEHVEVQSYGAAGRGGTMVSAPHVDFDEFRSRLNDYGDQPITFQPDPEFGQANMTAHIAASEIRYCRYLCDYGLCWLTGTRVDPRRYVYNCMSNRGLDRLPIGSSTAIIGALAAASKRSCKFGAPAGAVG